VLDRHAIAVPAQLDAPTNAAPQAPRDRIDRIDQIDQIDQIDGINQIEARLKARFAAPEAAPRRWRQTLPGCSS
jgi:hypothetical protein